MAPGELWPHFFALTFRLHLFLVLPCSALIQKAYTDVLTAIIHSQHYVECPCGSSVAVRWGSCRILIGHQHSIPRVLRYDCEFFWKPFESARRQS
jgi:hypothetical protein